MVHDTRTPGLMRLLDYLDEARVKAKAWLGGLWPCWFAADTG